MNTALYSVLFILSYVSYILFAGAEIAVVYISRESLERLHDNNIKGASILLRILFNKRQFTLLLLTGKIAMLTVGVLFLYHFTSKLITTGPQPFTDAAVTFAATLLLFSIADGFISRYISQGDLEQVIGRYAYFLLIYHILLFPLTFLLERFLSSVIKKKIELQAKEEALIEYVKSETEYGVIDEEEREMIESILELSETSVREVMVPRIDMVAVRKETDIDEIITLFDNFGHSRIPVYEERLDNIVGVVYAKDLLTHIAKKGREKASISRIMREAYFVPETKPISELLTEFKAAKVHLAIVVDEYGGTAGIVALEDLLEEIVGEIQDEYDMEQHDKLWLNDRTVLIDAGMDIDDVNELIHTTIPNEDFDTLGGFLYHQLGIIPHGGEIVEWDNVTFTVKEIEKNRIAKVIVDLPVPEQHNNGDKEVRETFNEQ